MPDEDFRLVTYSYGATFKHMNSAIVDDPDSLTGKTLRSLGNGDCHGVGKMIQATPTIKVPALKFSLGNIGKPRELHPGAKWEIVKVLDAVPQDEKYHWFKLNGAVELTENNYFWCHCWAIQFKTSAFYLLTDGVSDNNVWECWVSAKFTGPAYVPGSKSENAICVDMLALVRPGAKGVAEGD